MGRLLLRGVVVLIAIFLIAPIAAVGIWSFSGGPIFAFPPGPLTTRWYASIPASYLDALQVSLVVALCTTLFAVLVGVPAALALVRGNLAMRKGLSALFLSPLMVPTLVIGVAAFQFANVLYDLLRISLVESVPGLVLGHTAFTIPFVIRAVIGGQVQYDLSLEEAAVSLGATPFTAFRTVTLPVLAPAVASGALFAFLMSFDDVPVALFMGGGRATTLPVRILNSVQFDLSPQVLALCTVVAGAIVVMVVLWSRLFGLEKLMDASPS
jgi:putative spermidine/putrescine transport system permease protein